MDPEAEAEASSELKLPLFSKLTSTVGYDHQESPPHVSASVPFRWEEEPGKPRRCVSSSTSSTMISSSDSKCLELPPRLLLLDTAGATNKLASPATVFEGPYISSKPRSQSSSSFRVARKDWLYGSFRKGDVGTTPDDEKSAGHFGAVMAKRELKEKGLFGSFRVGRRVKREVIGCHGDSYVFPSFIEEEGDDYANGGGYFEKDVKKFGRSTGSFSAISHNIRIHFWTTIYEGLKQVVPWRNSSRRKTKRDGLMV